MSHQLTFADSEFSTKRRQTRKEIFLSRMEQILPWQNRGLRANDAKNHANSVSSLFILKLIGTAFTATSVVMVGLRDGSAWKKEIILL